MSSRFFLLSCLVLGLSACAPARTSGALESTSPAPSLSAREVAEHELAINRVLEDFHDAAARADETRYFAHFTDDAIFMGTDATERWSKSEFQTWSKPFFKRGKAWTFHAVRRVIHVDGGGAIAWFDEDLTTDGLGASRGSGVLVRSKATWRIAHYNLAITVPNERLDTVKDVLTAAVNQPEKNDPLERLSFMAGSWRISMPNGAVTEETWTTPSGGSLVGMGRSVRAGKTTFHEYLRIEARGDQIVYVAQPMGQPPTEFKLVPGAGKQATFENPQHDWPKRIRYERTNKGLAVRVDGDPGRPVEEWTFEPMVIERGR